jgi:hypothetical protein
MRDRVFEREDRSGKISVHEHMVESKFNAHVNGA